MLSSTADGVSAFLGVPYAEPPVRYSPPAPWTASYGPAGRPAIVVGQLCTQDVNGVVIGAEDCLFLNVWVPPARTARGRGHPPGHGNANAAAAAAPGPPAGRAARGGPGLPVMLFIHGGAFQFGGGSFYDGEFLAKERGAVVVTIK